jgi:hypothetical protein
MGSVNQVIEKAQRKCRRTTERRHRNWLACLIIGPLVRRQEFHLEVVPRHELIHDDVCEAGK